MSRCRIKIHIEWIYFQVKRMTFEHAALRMLWSSINLFDVGLCHGTTLSICYKNYTSRHGIKICIERIYLQAKQMIFECATLRILWSSINLFVWTKKKKKRPAPYVLHMAVIYEDSKECPLSALKHHLKTISRNPWWKCPFEPGRQRYNWGYQPSAPCLVRAVSWWQASVAQSKCHMSPPVSHKIAICGVLVIAAKLWHYDLGQCAIALSQLENTW